MRSDSESFIPKDADSLQQLVAHREMYAAAKDKLDLPAPIFDIHVTRLVSASSDASTSGSSEQWADMETRVLKKWDRKGKKPMRLLPDLGTTSAAVGGAFLGLLKKLLAYPVVWCSRRDFTFGAHSDQSP